jgi:hypothetical protein
MRKSISWLLIMLLFFAKLSGTSTGKYKKVIKKRTVGEMANWLEERQKKTARETGRTIIKPRILIKTNFQ